MVKNVISVDSQTKVTEVASILFEHKFHGMPVVNKGKVVGIITEDDFYIKETNNLFLPSYISFLKETKIIDDLPRERKDEIKKLLDSTAQDMMTPECLTVSPDMEIDELFSLIKKTKFNTLPVTDGEKNLVGIVTLMDVIGLFNRKQELDSLAESVSGSPREVDKLAQDVHSWWGKTFVLIRKTRVRSWKIIFTGAFIAGAIAALIWTISVRVEKKKLNYSTGVQSALQE